MTLTKILTVAILRISRILHLRISRVQFNKKIDKASGK